MEETMLKETKFCWLPTPIYKSSSNNKWLVFSRFIWFKRVTFTYIDHFNDWIALEKDQ